MKKAFYLLTLLLFLVSCHTTKTTPQNIVVSAHTTKEIVRDTVYLVKADTSSYTASLKVDSNGRIKIDNILNTDSGKYVKVPKVKIKNNKLQVDCYAEAQALYKQWIEQHQFDTKIETKIRTIKVDKPYPWYVIIQLWIARIILLIAIISLIGYYVKPLKFIRRG
jgi:hypothetical protein